MNSLFGRRFPPQLVEEVQQKCQVRGQLLAVRIVGDHRREALAVRRKIVAGYDGNTP